MMVKVSQYFFTQVGIIYNIKSKLFETHGWENEYTKEHWPDHL